MNQTTYLKGGATVTTPLLFALDGDTISVITVERYGIYQVD